MGSHPLNLAVRFLLEIFALISVSMWGWKQYDGWLQYVLAFGMPVLLAAIWGTFAVPDDPSRSGKTLIVTSGILRLAIELGIFSFATWSLYDIGFISISIVFGSIVLAHYIVSYDRIKWLISH